MTSPSSFYSASPALPLFLPLSFFTSFSPPSIPSELLGFSFRLNNGSPLNSPLFLKTRTFSYITTIQLSYFQNLTPIEYCSLVYSPYSNFPSCPKIFIPVIFPSPRFNQWKVSTFDFHVLKYISKWQPEQSLQSFKCIMASLWIFSLPLKWNTNLSLALQSLLIYYPLQIIFQWYCINLHFSRNHHLR